MNIVENQKFSGGAIGLPNADSSKLESESVRSGISKEQLNLSLGSSLKRNSVSRKIEKVKVKKGKNDKGVKNCKDVDLKLLNIPVDLKFESGKVSSSGSKMLKSSAVNSGIKTNLSSSNVSGVNMSDVIKSASGVDLKQNSGPIPFTDLKSSMNVSSVSSENHNFNVNFDCSVKSDGKVSYVINPNPINDSVPSPTVVPNVGAFMSDSNLNGTNPNLFGNGEYGDGLNLRSNVSPVQELDFII